MKRSVRDAWVADLRANPDKQGTGYLCQNGKYCCLGRLAEVAGVLHFQCETDPGLETFKFPVGRLFDFSDAMPPREWCEGVGLSYETARALARDNDDGLSFEAIANIIEDDVPVVED